MTEAYPIRIGTRGSKLALAQAQEVRARLMKAHALPQDAFAIEILSTAGDRIQDRALSEVGGKGLFTQEIEDGLGEGRLDIAVHSSKDMATMLPHGLRIGAFLQREDVRDVFIGRRAPRLQDLPPGAVVGSASLRRQALIRRMRPDLEVIIFRGNVQTRLAKLEGGAADGTLLAMAGLNRLGMADVATQVLDPETFPPAPGQGAICIECRVGDTRVERLIAPLDHAPTHAALTAERAFLRRLDGSCRTPIAALARLEGEGLSLHGMILTPDGTRMFEGRLSGAVADAAPLGDELGSTLLDRAGPDFFSGWGG